MCCNLFSVVRSNARDIGNAVNQRYKGELKEEIEEMTRGGSLIEAVIATHPFHTFGFKPFYQIFSSNHIKWYGTPRHLRVLPDIPWNGSVDDPIVQKLYLQFGVELSVPRGNRGPFFLIFMLLCGISYVVL